MRIRRGKPQDGAGLLKVHRASILVLGGAGYSPAEVESWATGLTAEGYGKAMTEGGETFAVAVDGAERIVGFCSYKDDEVAGLYVDPESARRGLGSRLLCQAEAAIADAGYKRVRLSASLGARRFYESQGYRVVTQREWKSRGGLMSDVLDMEKAL